MNLAGDLAGPNLAMKAPKCARIETFVEWSHTGPPSQTAGDVGLSCKEE